MGCSPPPPPPPPPGLGPSPSSGSRRPAPRRATVDTDGALLSLWLAPPPRPGSGGGHPQGHQARPRPGQRRDRPGLADRLRHRLATAARAAGARTARDHRRHPRLHGPRADRAHEPSIDRAATSTRSASRFYEMLTGSLPFTASDPMEWVHCHIARQPMPPGERVANLPAQVSAIIMKLLAKTAEDRYQTAAAWSAIFGAAWRNGRPRGASTTSRWANTISPDRLLIPEKLYGRERRGRDPARRLRARRPARRAGAGAGLRLFRHRQVVGGQRAAQGAGAAARAVRLRQVRPVQARHPYATLAQAFRA